MAYMNSQLNGLGTFDPTSLLPVAAKLISGGSGSGSSARGSDGINVSPVISAQVSPQISPIFQQQFQPSNSPISAGASQFMPTSQGAVVPGSIPGASPFPEMPSAAGIPVSLPGSAIPATIFGMQAKHVIIGAAILAAVLIIAKKQQAKRRTQTRRVDLEI